MSVSAKESSDAESNFHGVETGIVIPEAGIRDMQVARFQTPVIFRREDVRTERGRGGEVHVVRSRGYVVVGDEHSTVEFEVRREASVAFEIPLQSERAEPHTVGGIRGLENEKDGDAVDSVLKASAKKAGEMRAGKDPSIAQPRVEYANVLRAARHRVPASHPQLDFVATLFGTCLGDAGGCSK